MLLLTTAGKDVFWGVLLSPPLPRFPPILHMPTLTQTLLPSCLGASGSYGDFIEWAVSESNNVRNIGIELVELEPLNQEDSPNSCAQSTAGPSVAATCPSGFRCSARQDVTTGPACRLNVPGSVGKKIWTVYVFVALVVALAYFTIVAQRRSRQRKESSMREALIERQDGNAQGGAEEEVYVQEDVSQVP